MFRGAGVGPGDRVFYAFSFGPFIGFWAAYEGARKVGAMTVPGGGMQTEQRLQAMIDNAVTVLCCTPTYALRMAEVAEADRASIWRRSACAPRCTRASRARACPGVRARIEQAYGARCHDHTGMTELGATGFTCQEQDGVHLIESEFVFEVIDPNTCEPVAEGEQGELVATNLGRAGMPLIRYRTGDLVAARSDARARAGAPSRACGAAFSGAPTTWSSCAA